MRAGSAGSQGRRGGGPSARAITASTSSGIRERDAHRDAATRRPPRRRSARPLPSAPPGRVAASSVPITARLSAASVTRRLIRSGQFASRLSRITPAARCVPEDEVHAEGTAAGRDIREDGMQLGMVAQQRRELVDDDHEPRKVHARIEDVARPGSGDRRLAPACTSARRLSIARRAPAPSRSVITPVTCGTAASASNAVPPLKSARRKLTSRVECVAHSARIHVMSSSLLPEPVTPATTACGPSATRSRTAGSPPSLPITAGRRRRARPGARAEHLGERDGTLGRRREARALRSARAASSSAICSACSRPTASTSTERHLAGVVDPRARRATRRRSSPRTAADAAPPGS